MSPLFNSGIDGRDVNMFSKETQEGIGSGGTEGSSKEATILLKKMDKSEEKFIDTELDNIFTKLHEADDRIAKDREHTIHLAIETRTMLTDLRKQFS